MSHAVSRIRWRIRPDQLHSITMELKKKASAGF